MKMEIKDIKIEHTTDGIINVCRHCGEEVKSMLHVCPLIKNIKCIEDSKCVGDEE